MKLTYDRLTYAWVLLDLELSLFLDANPLVPLMELNAPLPGRDELWLASDYTSWRDLQARSEASAGLAKASNLLSSISLRTLFKMFLDDGLRYSIGNYLTIFTLRLLLYALHSQVHSLRQLFCAFGDRPTKRSLPNSRHSTQVHMEEVQCLLYRWYELFKCCRVNMANQPIATHQFSQPSTTAALVTYHVIFLNTLTSFTEIERLARQRVSDPELRKFPPYTIHRYVQDYEDALRHAGQVLYLLRTVENNARPPWWPAALYRATLILWICSVFFGASWRQSSSYTLIDIEGNEILNHRGGDKTTAVTSTDSMTSFWDHAHPPLVPALTNGNGSDEPVVLDDPIRTLETCLTAFQNGITTRLSEGIHRKLQLFLQSRYTLHEA
jgi:hypothetical protein